MTYVYHNNWLNDGRSGKDYYTQNVEQRGYGYEIREDLPSFLQGISTPVGYHANSGSLYGEALVSLCKSTRANIDHLKDKLTQHESCTKFGVEHWHPEDAKPKVDKPYVYPDYASPTWEHPNSLFTKKKDFNRINWNTPTDDDWEAKIEKPVSFCYLCSTLEEHQRHLARRGPQLKPKKKIKPRIEFIVPLPYVKQKKKEDEDEKEEVLYKISVKTGNKVDAATSADVFITMQGKKGAMMTKRRLKKKMCVNMTFGRGTTETFYLKGPKLGEIVAIAMEIEHEKLEKKHSWLLEEVEVTNVPAQVTWLFKCRDWITMYDRRRVMRAQLKEVPEKEYDLELTTGQLPLSGTDSNVFIILYGNKGVSPRLRIKGDSGERCFQRGQTNQISVVTNDVGKITRIKVEHDNSGKKSPDWFLEKVRLQTEDGNLLMFPCGEWLSATDGDGQVSRFLYPLDKKAVIMTSAKSLKAAAKVNKIKYVVTVVTGTKKYGGTDARVYLLIHGKQGQASEVELDDHKNNFETGMTDVFTVLTEDVGDIKRVRIRHDNAGLAAGWFLATITIRRYLTKDDVVAKLEEMGKQVEEEVIQKAAELTGISISGRDVDERRKSLAHAGSYKTDDGDGGGHRDKRKSSTGRYKSAESERKRNGKKRYNKYGETESESEHEARTKPKKDKYGRPIYDSDDEKKRKKDKYGRPIYDSDDEKRQKKDKYGRPIYDSDDEKRQKKDKYGRPIYDSDDEKRQKKDKYGRPIYDSDDEKRQKKDKYGRPIYDSDDEKRQKKDKYGRPIYDSDDEKRRKKDKYGRPIYDSDDVKRQKKDKYGRPIYDSDEDSENIDSKKGKYGKFSTGSHDKKNHAAKIDKYGRPVIDSDDEQYRKGTKKGHLKNSDEHPRRYKNQKGRKSQDRSSKNSDSDESDSDDDSDDSVQRRKRDRYNYHVTDSDDSSDGDEKVRLYEKWREDRIPFCDEYFFECHRWLAKDEDDGNIERVLKPISVTTFFRCMNDD